MLHEVSTCVALQHFVWQLLVWRLAFFLPLIHFLVCKYQHTVV
jgi:hypothetical protein